MEGFEGSVDRPVEDAISCDKLVVGVRKPVVSRRQTAIQVIFYICCMNHVVCGLLHITPPEPCQKVVM